MRAVRSQIQTESRMQKVIEKEKPTQAPRHPTTVESFERLINGEKNYDVIMGRNVYFLCRVMVFVAISN